MREIKFRAWNDKSKEMFDVDVLAINPVMWDSGGTGVSLAYQPHIKVMQYTGLKDKNGKEIYEGDVVESFTIPNGYICRGVVIFENGSFLMDVKNAPFAESGFKADFDERICEYTVLGNIYENPELLEELKNE